MKTIDKQVHDNPVIGGEAWVHGLSLDDGYSAHEVDYDESKNDNLHETDGKFFKGWL